MIAYADAYRSRLGGEPICRTVQHAPACGSITARGYFQARKRTVSGMRARHETLARDVQLIYAHRFTAVYGYRKMFMQLARQGWQQLGCNQVRNLMRHLGITGVRRGRIPITTRPARSRGGREDLVQRAFHADAPGRLHVADITYVKLASGSFACVAFVTDVFARRIVGWAVSASQHTRNLPLAALDQAIAWSSRHGNPQGLIHHSDHGTQCISALYSTHLAEAGMLAGTGSGGDSHDNALAETLNGAYRTESIKRVQPFDTVEALQQATFDRASRWNNQRLHQHLHYHTPAEAEAEHYQTQAAQTAGKTSKQA
ncbi:MAG: IS3 family transposase [Bifidobacterium sp.]|jgi:putative transposase